MGPQPRVMDLNFWLTSLCCGRSLSGTVDAGSACNTQPVGVRVALQEEQHLCYRADFPSFSSFLRTSVILHTLPHPPL